MLLIYWLFITDTTWHKNNIMHHSSSKMFLYSRYSYYYHRYYCQYYPHEYAFKPVIVINHCSSSSVSLFNRSTTALDIWTTRLFFLYWSVSDHHHYYHENSIFFRNESTHRTKNSPLLLCNSKTITDIHFRNLPLSSPLCSSMFTWAVLLSSLSPSLSP